MINKVVASAAEAVADIHDGASLAVGGFGLCGIPTALMQGLDQRHGNAAQPEPADGERGAVVDVRDSLGGAGNNFVDHR